ncbi:MAG: hypothetical protein AB7F66_09220 [Bacteriovoracia bacterium]
MAKRIDLENIEDIKELLRKEIVVFMKAHSMSQYGVSKDLGLPAAYINQVLGGKQKAVSFAKLCEIANKIGMKLTLIIGKK